MKTEPLAQDKFLEYLSKDNQYVSIYLISGIRLQGQMTGWDKHSVILNNPFPQIIYKHAIATIMPHSMKGTQTKQTESLAS